MRDSGNVVVKNRYPVMKSEKSFHFDNTLVAHIFLDPVAYFILTVPLFLIPPSSTAGSSKMRESGTSVRHFLRCMSGIGISR